MKTGSNKDSLFEEYTMSSPYETYDKITSIDWNGKYFILTARSEITDGSFSYAYSIDGQHWTQIEFGTNLSTTNPYSAKWLGDKFILAGNLSINGFGSTQPCLVNVIDGSNPATIPTNLSSDTVFYDIEKSVELPNSILFPRTTILALGDQIKISIDQGNSWGNTNASSVFSSCHDAVWNGRHWVAVGQGQPHQGTIATSLDGVYWLDRGNSAFSTSCNGIDWSPQQNKYVAIGQGNGCVVSTSFDGIYWLSKNTSLFSVGNDVKWNGAIWVSTGESVSPGNTIAYSTDGDSWAYSSSSFATRGLRVYWDGSIWTAFGEDPSYNIATSIDGVSWNLKYVFGANKLNLGSSVDPSLNLVPDIPFVLADPGISTNKYVHNHSDRGSVNIPPISIASGEGTATLAYSSDGIKWNAINNGLFSRSNKACWNGSIWVAVGTGSYCIATSFDGIEWSGVNNSIFAEAYDVAWNGKSFVAVGYGSSRIATSSDGLNWNAISESVFSANAHSIDWTGYVWLAYGSGTNTTAISEDGMTWSPTPVPNLCVADCSNLTLNGATSLTASSYQVGFGPENSNNHLFYGINSEWRSLGSNYDASGNYTGSASTTYNSSSQTVQGEWIQVQLNAPAVCSNYHVIGTTDSSYSIPYSFSFLGSMDGSTWDLIDQFSYSDFGAGPPNNSSSFTVLPLSISSNTTSYSYYRLVMTRTFGSDFASLAEIALFDGGQKQLDRFVRPVILKDCILHPTLLIQSQETTPNICRITDLSCNLIQTQMRNGYYVDNILFGLSSKVSASSFNGECHVICSKSGEVSYLSNSASLTTLNYDNSLNGVGVESGLTDIGTACFNRRFILLGGAGGATYGIIRHNSIPSFYTTNLGSIMTTVYGLASNPGYGYVVCNNSIHLKDTDRLTITTPKFYNGSQSDTSISFNLHKT